MVKLYGRHTSLNVQKVLWLLEELGISFDHQEIGGSYGSLNTQQFLNMNPMGKIPVLVDGKKIIWESNTILRYLGTVYADECWFPVEPYERSLIERWMDWSQTALHPCFTDLFMKFYRTPTPERDQSVILSLLEQLDSCLIHIEQHLEKNTFISGETIGIADICVGIIFYRLQTMGIKKEILPKTQAWYCKLSTRPAYEHCVMSSYEELKK